jgi:Relaxase/Mobilisation nuclease domain
MIGKITQGSNFQGCINYLLGKDGAEIVGGNLLSTTPSELGKEFSIARDLTPAISKPVFHISISLNHQESLSKEQWAEVADRYVEEMGFTKNQYLVVQHHDKSHEHIHILANRLNLNCQAVSDWWSKKRTEKILRGIEKDYGLEVLPYSWEKADRSKSTNQRYGQRTASVEPIADTLQQVIDKAINHSGNLRDFQAFLQFHGVEVRLRDGDLDLGKASGISYRWNNVCYKSSDLGSLYSASKIIELLSREMTKSPVITERELGVSNDLTALDSDLGSIEIYNVEDISRIAESDSAIDFDFEEELEDEEELEM